MNYVFRLVKTALLSILLMSCLAQPKTSLTADEFEKQVNSNPNAQLLDVRTPDEFFSGHIKNALLADWTNAEEFQRRVSFIDKAKPLYVYCLSGGRSAAAAAKLRKMGYENVYELRGGTNAWRAAGKPLEGNSHAVQMTLDDLYTAINSSPTVLVDFGASWCPPCLKMEPVLKSLETNNPGKYTLVKVDGGRDQNILQQFKVTALPVFIVFKNGKQVWRRDGMADEKELAEQLK